MLVCGSPGRVPADSPGSDQRLRHSHEDARARLANGSSSRRDLLRSDFGPRWPGIGNARARSCSKLERANPRTPLSQSCAVWPIRMAALVTQSPALRVALDMDRRVCHKSRICCFQPPVPYPSLGTVRSNRGRSGGVHASREAQGTRLFWAPLLLPADQRGRINRHPAILARRANGDLATRSSEQHSSDLVSRSVEITYAANLREARDCVVPARCTLLDFERSQASHGLPSTALHTTCAPRSTSFSLKLRSEENRTAYCQSRTAPRRLGE